MKGHDHGDMTHFTFWGPSHIFGTGETRHFKFDAQINTAEYYCRQDRLPPKACIQGHVTALIFVKLVILSR